VEVLRLPAASLPTIPEAYDSVSVLVIGADPVTPEQSAAVRRWVRSGGRLIAAPGSEAERFAASPLAEWLPTTIGPIYAEQQTEALTGRVMAFVPNKGGPLLSLDKLRLARLTVNDGVALIAGPTAPAVARSAYGLGLATAVGLQLNAPPFYAPAAGDKSADGDKAAGGGSLGGGRTWGGLQHLCQRLAQSGGEETGERPRAAGSQLAPTGVSDMQSQLYGALDHFPEVDRPSTWNVIGLLVLYLLLVGPIDYLLVHKLLRRPHLTWATLPAWALLASWWATSTAASSNGVATTGLQVELLDVAADTGVQRVSAWLSLYSQETRRHTVAATPAWPAGSDGESDVRIATLARPEEGFRGLYRRGGLQLAGAAYELQAGDATATAEAMPVEQWGSLQFAVSGSAQQPADAPPLIEFRRIVGSDGIVLRTELTHRLPGEVTDWFLVEDLQTTFPLPQSDRLQTLASGTTYDLQSGCGQRLLKAYIQGEVSTEVKRKTGTDIYIGAESYDPLGRDLRPLLRTLSFFRAVQGREHTQLANQSLARHDLSDLIHLGRVILFGRLSSSVARFEVDGVAVAPARRETWVRLAAPIVRTTTATP